MNKVIYSEIVDLVQKEKTQVKFLKPFEFPEGNGEKKIYVVELKEDSPFEFAVVCGESIEKYKYSNDYGLARNYGKPPKQVAQRFKWSKKQKEAFEKRSREIEKMIICKEEKVYKKVIVGDYIDITLQEEYHKKFQILDEEISP